MTIDEIIALMEKGEPVNPLAWPPGDRLRYCLVTLDAMEQMANYIVATLNGDKPWPGEDVEDEDLQDAFRSLDRFMLMAHNVHTIMQSVLTVEQRQQILREKTELMTGQAVKHVQSLQGPLGTFLAIEFEDEDMVPDDLTELGGEDE